MKIIPSATWVLVLGSCLGGCTAPAAITSTVHVERAAPDQLLVSIRIQQGAEVLCAPKVLCQAGEPASVELIDADQTIHIEIEPPLPDGPDAVEVQIALSGAPLGPIVLRILVPVGATGTITTSVD
jgi:hypothetical protein